MAKTFVYDKAVALQSSDGKNITLSVFFDGTQNNKTNTEIGEKRRKAIEEQGIQNYKNHFEKTDSDPAPNNPPTNSDPTYGTIPLEEVVITAIAEKGDSYENDYTNVARLWKSYDVSENIHDRIYVEGVGTVDGKKPPKDDVYIDKCYINDKGEEVSTEDDMATVGLGVFSTSVRGKARIGCKKMIDKLYELLKPIKNSKEKFINTLTIDVFGFSRGSTTARCFTHFISSTETAKERSKYFENHDISKEMMPIVEDIKTSCKKNFEFWDDETLSKIEKAEKLKPAITKTSAQLLLAAEKLYKVVDRAYSVELHDYFQQQLKSEGIKVNHINVRFLGLFDTVSSYGLFHDNDVQDLSLDAVNKAQKVVQLAAADEYRKNFALTNIKNAGFKGIELYLPGVHCDVGGAYNNMGYEKTAFYITSLYDEKGLAPSNFLLGPLGSYIKETLEPNSRKFKNKLVEDGWLKENQWEFTYKNWLGGGTKAAQSVVLTGVLQNIIKQLPSVKGVNYLKEINRKMLEGLQVGLPPFGILYGRRMISNKYTFIPLEFMADFAKESGVPINKEYFSTQGWTIGDDLQYTKRQLTKYKNKIVNLRQDLLDESKKEEIERMQRDGLLEEAGGFVEDLFTSNKEKKYLKKCCEISYSYFFTNKKELHHLRNKYLHWSAKSDSFGLDPVTRSQHYEKKRVIYKG
ncbi:hypothetical protein AXA65_17090 [Chryseobacterium sp. FP211-J200]|uniref:phospholipase effector Tle1 domain-containing protein n=1 Tax=Chryseobacterium group TaxID=2782232 RepID=UPI0007C7F751|nr:MULTISPECIES: DUF2235 domain-containing protein [Chryseobacterium group]MBV6881793.1 DUF2235 domain-containing protein [Epilithonimonas sp. FP105]OAH68523.1 hypothetical protein AXA65_17090 [Chryseobacterium sp. FP211-J200]